MIQSTDKFLLENMIFDAIEYLEKNSKVNTTDPTLKIRYQSGLAALDLLNDEYKKLTGDYCVPQERVLTYYSKQWSHFS